MNQYGPSSQVVKCLSFSAENELVSGRPTPEALAKKGIGRYATVRQSATSQDPSMLVNEIRKLELRQRQLGEEANRALEVLQKEVVSHKLGTQDAAETIAKLLSEIKDVQVASSVPEQVVIRDKADLKEEITRLNSSTIASLERKLENVQNSIDKLVLCFPSGEETPDSKSQVKKKKILPFSLNNSSNMQNFIRAPCSPQPSSKKIAECEIENRAPENVSSGDTLTRLNKVTPPKSDDNGNSISSRDSTPISRHSNSVNMKKMQRMFKNAAEDNIRSIRAYVTELKERVAKLQYQKQLLVCQVSSYVCCLAS